MPPLRTASKLGQPRPTCDSAAVPRARKRLSAEVQHRAGRLREYYGNALAFEQLDALDAARRLFFLEEPDSEENRQANAALGRLSDHRRLHLANTASSQPSAPAHLPGAKLVAFLRAQNDQLEDQVLELEREVIRLESLPAPRPQPAPPAVRPTSPPRPAPRDLERQRSLSPTPPPRILPRHHALAQSVLARLTPLDLPGLIAAGDLHEAQQRLTRVCESPLFMHLPENLAGALINAVKSARGSSSRDSLQLANILALLISDEPALDTFVL